MWRGGGAREQDRHALILIEAGLREDEGLHTILSSFVCIWKFNISKRGVKKELPPPLPLVTAVSGEHMLPGSQCSSSVSKKGQARG